MFESTIAIENNDDRSMNMKFQNTTTEQLNEIALNGFCDDQIGSVTEGGYWFGLLLDTGIENAEYSILIEDDQGFVDLVTFSTETEAKNAWNAMEEVAYRNS